jgi:NAD+ synthase
MTSQTLHIGIAQINPTLGDIAGNIDKIRAAYHVLAKQGADIVVFPEMIITGYPPEDLVLKKAFQDTAMEAVETLAKETAIHPAAILVGGIWRERDVLHNSAFFLEAGKVQYTQHKMMLPNYGVFDEKRVFTPGALPNAIRWRGIRLGVLICEDAWGSAIPKHLASQDVELFISINASPYEMGKASKRRKTIQSRVSETDRPIVYVNMVGGQDELVFDGRSFVLNHQGGEQVKLSAFQEILTLTKWNRTKEGWLCEAQSLATQLSDAQTVYQAMMLGLRDYVKKNRFMGVILGLSGGIDSAITAAVAVDALGAERVYAVMLPSPYTSKESLDDATECAKRLGIALDTISIEQGMQALEGMLQPRFTGKSKDITEENIQSRLRGLVLMAISNKEGLMVLTTGNKSEMSVGYATLYGDMCGGYSVLKDVYKTTVYKVSEWRNQSHPQNSLCTTLNVIPERILTKAPTAELKPNQKDQDSLPPYDVLDAILERLVEKQLSTEDIIAQGYDAGTVERVARLLYAAEYKRRQSPPGVKITGMAFGRDRRYPITNAFKK